MNRKHVLLLFLIPLIFSCKKKPTPNYEINVLNCENPYLVAFTDLSENTTQTEWYIDGEYHVGGLVQLNLHSGEPHILQLIASNGDKRESLEEVFYVADYYELPTANFTYYFPNCEMHESVTFYDKTEGVLDQYFWDFGDGTTSALQNPEHTYAADGTYEVKLCAIRCNDSIWTAQNVTITAANVAPRADIDMKALIADYELPNANFLRGSIIEFESNSTYNTTQLWRFDGNTESGTRFTESFHSNGEYEIELVAICGDKRDSVTQRITIRDPKVMLITNAELEDFDDENEDNESWDDDGGNPDIYLKIKKGGSTLETTSTRSSVSSSSTPDWSMDEELTDMDYQYTIEIWDSDSGSDELMFELDFEPEDFFSVGSYPSKISISEGDWEVELTVEWE
jgi:PKD repeat protein